MYEKKTFFLYQRFLMILLNVFTILFSQSYFKYSPESPHVTNLSSFSQK